MAKFVNNIVKFVSKIARKIVKYDDLVRENQLLKEKYSDNEKEVPVGWPNGHFYSPIHRLEDLTPYDNVVAKSKKSFEDSMPGFIRAEIIKNFKRIKKYFKDFNYPQKENKSSNFYITNPSYPITDALVLFGMLRDLKPKKIIEIGSGFSSALMMDVNKRFFHNNIEITFIEPYPELLISRMDDEDKQRYTIIKKKVQDVPVKEFFDLKENDILFIDSTHVSKFNSDVNYELFNILPIIKSEVYIHFHDVFDGFEYPLEWLRNGWAWNEDYLLRAYLTNNPNYEVVLMNDYLVNRYKQLLDKSFERVPNNCGGSLWIKKH